MQQIEAFLDRHEGYKAFLWSPYHSTQGKFKCSKWDIEQKESHWTISCEFKEVVA
ncbi:Phage minor tail protein tail protein M [Pasteurella multocida subsp. gallicida P1059]|nr:Phage minor tail protein tail protein M [Pasteurella multocida subsp. gallicida P1059]